LFDINTVIGHLWHAVPGSFTQRMYGSHDNPHLYAYLGLTADHFHWDTADTWDKIRSKGVSPTTDQAGGGHAHTGLLIYQGDNWPAPYRGKLFTINLHGRRLNSDTLERRGSGYVGRHGPDFLRSSDPWLRPIDLISGPDGGVYLADWSDIGECHENDGVHRSSGRIYRITYGSPKTPAIADVSGLTDAELVRLQSHANDWFTRQARHVLQERAAAGRPMGEVHATLRTLFKTDPDGVHKLRALWGLYVTGGAPDDWLLGQLGQGDEHVRSWAVRLLADGKAPVPEAVRALTAMSASDRSGLVLLYLASTLQKIPTPDRWGLAEGLASRSEYADDPVLPLMIWYGIEAAVPDDPARAVRLAGSSGIPTLTRMIARRLTENLERVPGAVDSLVALAVRTDRARVILSGMAEALRGWRRAQAPPTWGSASKALDASPDADVRRLARELSVVFGDGRAMDDVLRVASSQADANARRDAIRVLVEARDAKVVPLLRNLLTDRDLGDSAARGLAAFDDPENTRTLIARFRGLRPSARAEAVVTLTARPSSARALLDAVSSGAIDRDQVPAFQVRQMLSFPDDDLRRRVAET
ncbi:MAG: dehydrogenase, partial [Planctomycetia bacterium]|nr:dehydrogenase [Planctomycetia bacterium]